MYNASAQFHNAVFENSPVERVLFRFADGTIFTNEDIHIGNGLKVIEAVNLEEELTIGACPAASLDVTIMNYHGLLSGFAFGEAEVSLGVRTEVTNMVPAEANAVAYVAGRRLCGHSEVPYLTMDGEATTEQPDFPVHAIVADGTHVYCLGLEGECWAASITGGMPWDDLASDSWSDLEGTTWDELQGSLVSGEDVELSPFMVAKAIAWAKQGRGLWSNGNVIYEYYTDGTVEKFEYAKLGTFLLKTPAKRKINLISVSALDRMSLFDREADDFWNGLTYPITIGEIFTELCDFVGVPSATSSFINSARFFDEAPIAADGITAREILGWIAEAACSFARMTRDGEVELAWFGVRPVSIPMTQYFSIAPAEYEVAQVDKLQISGSETDIGVVIGEGTNGYQILDNPLLYGATDTEVRTLGVPIYNRLIAYAAFSPIVATAVCDWSIQAGDIIEIALNGVPYALPVYTQTITWKGNARVTYESTGAEKRPVMTATNRRLYKQKRAIHEVSETVDGLTRHLEDVDGNIADLDFTTAGLALALNANKLSFDASGLTVQGGGIRIKNNAGADVFYADISGNLKLKGILDGVSGSFTGLTASGSINFSGGMLEIGMIGGGDSGQLSFAHGSSSIDCSGGILSLVCGGGIEAVEGPFGVNEKLYLGDVSQSSGGNQYLAWNMSTGEVLYSSPSSIRFKKDIEDIDVEYAKSVIKALEIKRFAWKDSGEISYGAIAEKVAGICPWLVNTEHVNGRDIPLGVAYEANLPILIVPFIQDTERRVTALEKAWEAKHGSLPA